MPKLIDRLPAVLANRLRTRTGTQFVRFVLVAAVSLGASQIALFLFIGPMHLTGGVSGVLARDRRRDRELLPVPLGLGT